MAAQAVEACPTARCPGYSSAALVVFFGLGGGGETVAAFRNSHRSSAHATLMFEQLMLYILVIILELSELKSGKFSGHFSFSSPVKC